MKKKLRNYLGRVANLPELISFVEEVNSRVAPLRSLDLAELNEWCRIIVKSKTHAAHVVGIDFRIGRIPLWIAPSVILIPHGNLIFAFTSQVPSCVDHEPSGLIPLDELSTRYSLVQDVFERWKSTLQDEEHGQ